MATITAASTAAGSTFADAKANVRLTPEKYTTIDTLLDHNKPEVMEELVQTFGEQGITGFLKLTGAINSGGSADQVEYFEEGRRHRTLSVNSSGTTASSQTLTINIDADTTDGHPVGANDVIMDTADGKRYVVTAVGVSSPTGSGATTITAEALDGSTSAVDNYDAAASDAFIVLGNMYGQGTEQPAHFTDVDVKRRKNPYMIVKDRFQVNGSQATNIGYINVGGDYRWFMYGEQEARKRFEDRREMMLLFSEKRSGGADGDGASAAYNVDQDTGFGSEGYVSAIEDRGIVGSALSHSLAVVIPSTSTILSS